MEAQEFVRRANTVHDAIGRDLNGLGGFLRCGVCGARDELGNTAHHLKYGWPRHCGKTMTWWTQRQIDAGEVPA